MVEFASRNPYIEPVFTLSVAYRYEYETLTNFTMAEGSKVFPERLVISIEQYKDKHIVVFRASSAIGGQASQIRLQDHQLEKTAIHEFQF